MNQNPSVSVIIPVYCKTPENIQHLKETLQSVALQTFSDFEIVIVDDLSPMDIMPIVQSIDGLPATVVLRNAVNMGHAESRNIGIRAANGEYVAFLDHDDLWMPDKLSQQMEIFRKKNDTVMVFCDVEITGSYPAGLYIDQRIIPEQPSLRWFLSHNNSVITASSVLVKKQAILDIGLFDSRYSSCDDYDAWIKILMRNTIIHLPEKLAKYRLHSGNLNYAVNRANDNRLITALLWKCWRKMSIIDKAALLPTLARKTLGRLYYILRRSI